MPALAALSEILSGAALIAYAALTLWLAARPRGRMAALMPAPGWLVAAAAATGLWCAALYIYGPGTMPALLLRSLCNLVLLGWLAATFWTPARPMSRPLRLILRLLVTIGGVALLGGGAAFLRDSGAAVKAAGPALGIAAMITASGGLLLVDSAVRHASAGLRTPVLAVAGGFAMLWAYELNIQLIGALTGKPAMTLIRLLPVVALLMLPTFIVAAMDIGRERMQLSRTAAMRSIALIAAAAYLVLIGLAGAFARLVGGDYGDVAQGLFLSVALGIGGLLLLSARARAWLSVTISKHFFEHRYDYRAEWMRFTATLAEGGGEDAGNLYRRAAKALAELTGSPAALLLLPDAQGGFRIADRWRWSADSGEASEISLRCAFMLQETQHIVDLDALRRGRPDAGADLAIPDWLIADTRAWVVVPVLHFQRMIAIAVLHRPPVSRALDWEDLDVLRIAGRQAASYLAESRSQQALSEAKRFDEFNRRFAFIMHDIKNLASQLSLLARNAERHADKPAFRADMVETLKISSERLSGLLARLSPRARGPAAGAGRLLVEPVLAAAADGVRQRRSVFTGCATGLAAWADAASVRQIVDHLLANALDASADGAPVQLLAAAEQGRVRIDVIDQGTGMSRAFIRDELFKPFVSTKDGGFGLGAFEALQLAQAQGGTIDVASEPGAGSRFTLWLPLADERAGDDRRETRKVASR